MSEYSSKIVRKAIRFHGSVQGVGFRYRAVHSANAFGATGWVRNEADGSVSMEIQATEEVIDRVLMQIEAGSYIHIESLEARSLPPVTDERTFHTRSSRD